MSASYVFEICAMLCSLAHDVWFNRGVFDSWVFCLDENQTVVGSHSLDSRDGAVSESG
jgi:predicted restriction endonuclease